MTEDRKSFSCAGCAHWGLIGSMAVNLFLVGVIVGPLLGRGPQPEHMRRPFGPPGGPGFIFDRMGHDLPEQDAQKLRAIFDEERDNLHRQHEAMHQTMRRVATILKADKPDMEALRRTLDEIHGLGQTLHEGMARALERMATELPPESRRKIAARMEAMPAPPDDPHEPGAPLPPDGGPLPPQ